MSCHSAGNGSGGNAPQGSGSCHTATACPDMHHAVVIDRHPALALGAFDRACLPCAGEWQNQAPFLLVKPEGVAPEVLTRKVDLGIL